MSMGVRVVSIHVIGGSGRAVQTDELTAAAFRIHPYPLYVRVMINTETVSLNATSTPH